MPRRSLPGLLTVGATVAAAVLWLARSPSASSGVRLAMVATALGAHALVVAVGRQPGRLSRSVVIGGIAIVLTASVIYPPRDSNDLWGYVSYARVLTAHHENPYVHPPAEFPDDPLVDRMSEEYRATPTIYGPLFTTVSAAGTLAAGPSPIANRLFFQLLSLGAAIVALVLVDRRLGGRDPTALAFLGLSPVVMTIVNGAHTDLIIGTLLLGAVIVAARRRPVLTGALLAAAALIKVVALAPVAAVIVWSWRRFGARVAIATGAVAAATVGLAYLLVGGTAALQPVRDGRLFAARSQAWEILRGRWSDALAADGVRDAAEIAHTDIARIATPIVALLVVLALWRLTRDRHPEIPVAGAGLAFLLAAPYVLPWYAGWVLPSAAVTWRRGVAILAQMQAALVFLVYADPPGRLPPEGPLLDFSSRYAPMAGIGLAVAFVVLCFVQRPDGPDRSERVDRRRARAAVS